MKKIPIGMELDEKLYKWFEAYCEDGLMDLDEELSALVAHFMQEQLEDEGQSIEPQLYVAEGDDADDSEDNEYSDEYFHEVGED